MKKGQICDGIVEKVNFPNKGIVSVEDRQVTVKNGIPGQKVSFAIQKMRKGKAEGRLLEVLEKSPLELEEVNCPHFGICGGCNYQSLPYEEQLKLKSGQVLELMRSVVPNVEDIFEGIKESPRQFGYRNKMEYTFGDEIKDGPLALGMHKRGSFYDIVTVDGCVITDEDYRKILSSTVEYFRNKEVGFYHRMSHTGYLRHLLVRKAVKTGEILIDLISTTQISQDEEAELLESWKSMLLNLKLEGSIAGILHTKNDSVADAVKNEGTEILFGQDFFYEELLGLKFRISPFSFFQTNSLGAEVLYETAREFIGDTLTGQDSVVFDLYSGTGTIAQMLAPVAKKVIGVEIIEEAVEAAKENAALNHLDNCEFIAGDVLKVIDDISEKPDFIVLDPPRDGIHPKALEKIIRYGVDQMVYISCKPTSLQRDLEILQARGYQVERICCVDMFPGTVHVETVAVLSRKSASKSFIPVSISPKDMGLSEEKEQPTYANIRDYVQKTHGMKVSSLYVAQMKAECGLETQADRSGDKKQPKCPPEKREAILDAFRHFGLMGEDETEK